MKKYLPSLAIAAVFAVVALVPNVASAATASSATTPGAKTLCEKRVKDIGGFTQLLSQFQYQYYGDVLGELAKANPDPATVAAFPKKDSVLLGGTAKVPIYPTTGKWQAYDTAGKAISGKTTNRLNYPLFIHSHEGSLATAKALGKGIESKPSVIKYGKDIETLRGGVFLASKQIDTAKDKWATSASPAVVSSIDCAKKTGAVKAKTLRTDQLKDLKAIKDAQTGKNGVRNVSKIVSRDYIKVKADYNALKKKS